jgi:HSP20 family protein
MAMTRREAARPPDVFERFFGHWPEVFRRPVLFWPETMDDVLRVDEFEEDGTLVVRADLPGIDPKKDVEVTVTDGTLQIAAERRQEETTDKKDFYRHELRYGTFTRVLPIPEGTEESDVQAAYKDGVLEIRVPVRAPAAKAAPRKIPVDAS